MWALEYFTTPSSPCSFGPSPSTAMIEFTLTDDTTGISWMPRMKGLRGDMLSTADGMNGLTEAPGFLARSAVRPVTGSGGSSSHRTAVEEMASPATEAAPGGVEMVHRRDDCAAGAW